MKSTQPLKGNFTNLFAVYGCVYEFLDDLEDFLVHHLFVVTTELVILLQMSTGGWKVKGFQLSSGCSDYGGYNVGQAAPEVLQMM